VMRPHIANNRPYCAPCCPACARAATTRSF
jgi:hypothetical protein